MKNMKKKRQVTIICQYCKNPFDVYASWSGFRKRCSKRCESLDKKGKHISPDTEIKAGQHLSPNTEIKSGHIPWHKGTNNSPMKGVKRPQSFCDKVSGENNTHWKGGITPINQKIRTSREYLLWRISVFERDDYTCQICGERGGKLNADHIKPFSLYPELRFAIDNGRTLCFECHKNTETFGGKMFKYLYD